MKAKFISGLKDYLGIIVGAIFMGMSYAWFMIPFKVAPGGVGGISQILFHILGIPAGISMIIINIPLFVIGLMVLGKRFGIRSFFGMMISSFATDLLAPELLYKHFEFLHPFINTEYWAFTDNIFLASIAGSVLLGFGLGVIFRFQGSTGGTDIPVAVLRQKTGISMGSGYWVIETLIIFTIGFVFQDLNLIIWGYLNLFITTKIVDITAEGLPYIKGAYIISDNEDVIKERIFHELNRGVTIINAEGGFTGKKRRMIFCAINRRQIALLRRIVKECDKDAFMLLSDIYDVMGYGFKSRDISFTDDN